ncbi:MAG: hypothetical protein ACK5WV_11555, partial [Chryseotalea sp.]
TNHSTELPNHAIQPHTRCTKRMSAPIQVALSSIHIALACIHIALATIHIALAYINIALAMIHIALATIHIALATIHIALACIHIALACIHIASCSSVLASRKPYRRIYNPNICVKVLLEKRVLFSFIIHTKRVDGLKEYQ